MVKKTLTDFANETASESPAPGGGSISAYVGALGISLGTMVANLSAHKVGWDDKIDYFSEQASIGQLLKDTLLDLVDSDTHAFNKIMDAIKMHKATDEEKAARKAAMVMGRKCIWERFYFKIKGDRTKANRRKSYEGVSTTINESEFKTWYYSPKEIERHFNTFKAQRISGIGLFVPPSYLNSFFEHKKVLLKVFSFLDKVFCKFKWTADYADHYLIHLKKDN